MKFFQVAETFEKIEKVTSRLEITQYLADLLKKATPQEAAIICYIALGKLQPPYIGTQFNLSEKSLVPVVADILGWSDSEVKRKVKQLGDLGLVIGAGKWEAAASLTVTKVYKWLTQIEKISGIGSQEEKAIELTKLLEQLTPLSAQYVVRIVIGKLRLGFSDMTIVDALSWMEVGNKSLRKIIEQAYNVCADIGLIAKTLKQGGVQALEQMHAQVGIPIRPAAAERLPTAQAVIDKIGPCIAQPKLDGFRLQIHLDKTGSEPKVYFYSRNLTDMSYMFPDLKNAVEQIPCKSMICEGEAICFDPHTGHFLPFQETVKRKRKHGIDQAISEYPLKIYLFDLLYLNGKDLMDESHAERRKKLLDLMKDVHSDTVQVIQEVRIKTAKQLEDYFYRTVEMGLEGLVVKREDSHYQPGKRNFNWIKLKRQEEGQLEDTIDCVVLGYYAGKGKRVHFGIGACLVGVFNKGKDCFQTIAKIGTGLTDEQWVELKKKCDAIAVKEQPHNVECPKELYPDVWVNPELVCLVRADEISKSPTHAAGKTQDTLGYALRFPRFMGYRPDKSATSATTVHEIKRLYDDQFLIKKKK